MPYKILSNDVLDDDDQGQRGGPPPRQNVITISPFIVHVIIIILIIGVLFVGYFMIFSGDDDKEVVETITLVGTLEEFNRTYVGDLSFSSGAFTLRTDNGVFEEGSNNVLIEDFNGTISLFNRSIFFNGSAQNIKFNKNTINLKGDHFEIASPRRTNMNLYFEQATFPFKKGRVKIDNGLNFEFTNATANLDQYNVSIAYDGIFSMSGSAQSLVLEAPEEKLSITYTR